MSAAQKEQIYVELRKYHLDEFPETLSNSNMDDLLTEFRKLEDEVISMLLGFVNGKSEYVDMSESLSNFGDKVKVSSETDKLEINDRQHFSDKNNQLKHLLATAKNAVFKLKPIRQIRESTRKVITKVNKSKIPLAK